MRHLLTLIVVGILIVSAGSAVAENFRQGYDKSIAQELQDPLLARRGHATLTLSPMYLEIHGINEAAKLAEAELLALVVASTDEGEVLRLVHSLQRLDTDRQIDILKVQIRYAQMGGRHELVFRLRKDVLQLLQTDVAPLM